MRHAELPLPAAAIPRVLTGYYARIRRLRELTVVEWAREPSAVGTRTVCDPGPAMLTRWILASGVACRTLVALPRWPVILAANAALSHLSLILEHDVLRRQRIKNE